MLILWEFLAINFVILIIFPPYSSFNYFRPTPSYTLLSTSYPLSHFAPLFFLITQVLYVHIVLVVGHLLQNVLPTNWHSLQETDSSFPKSFTLSIDSQLRVGAHECHLTQSWNFDSLHLLQLLDRYPLVL